MSIIFCTYLIKETKNASYFMTTIYTLSYRLPCLKKARNFSRAYECWLPDVYSHQNSPTVKDGFKFKILRIQHGQKVIKEVF